MIMDTYPADHPAWKHIPAPPGYKIAPFTASQRFFMAIQEHTTTITFVTCLTSLSRTTSIPEFLVMFVVKWLCPTITRSMVRKGSECVMCVGPFEERTKKDVHGVYGRCNLLIESGTAMDKVEGGRPRYTAQSPPPPSLIKNR